jgi:hypothetical protein
VSLHRGEIRSGYLPNTKPEHCRYGTVLRRSLGVFIREYTRAVCKARGLAAARRSYAEGDDDCYAKL